MTTPEGALATHEWGTGEHVAVILHGMFNCGQAWEPLGRALASAGYRAIAVDLPGHGHSPRYDDYPPALFADAVVASVPARPALVVGHSFGGYVAQRCAARLAPERAVLVDPALDITGPTVEAREATFVQMSSWVAVDPEQLARDNPHWSADARALEVRGRELFDPGTLEMLRDVRYAGLDTRPACPTLVLVAERDSALGPAAVARLTAQGHTVRTVPGVGHCIDRDDPAALAEAVLSWAGAVQT